MILLYRMKSLLILLFFCCIIKSSIAQFPTSKILNPDTIFSSTLKTDLIKSGRWELITEFTLVSGTIYQAPEENISFKNFQFFDSAVSGKYIFYDSLSYFPLKYMDSQNSFRIKVPFFITDNNFTYLFFDYKICYFDSTYLLVERNLNPTYFDTRTRNILSDEKVRQFNRWGFPIFTLYSEKSRKSLRKFILFEKV